MAQKGLIYNVASVQTFFFFFSFFFLFLWLPSIPGQVESIILFCTEYIIVNTTYQ